MTTGALSPACGPVRPERVALLNPKQSLAITADRDGRSR